MGNKREKVTAALKVCKWRYEDYEGYWPNFDYGGPDDDEYVCVNCPYRKTGDEFEGYDSCLEELHKDALELIERAGCFLEEGLHYFPCGRGGTIDE